jgi:hypothetical protein
MILSIVISRELKAALWKASQIFFCDTRIFLLQGDDGLSNRSYVPNQHAPDKESVSCKVPRGLKRKLERLAAQRGETLSELVVGIFTKATDGITLTSDDYEEIARATRAAEQGRKIDGRRRKRADGPRTKGEA